MSTGSLRDVSRALNAHLSTTESSYPLPDSLLAVIQAYLDRHQDIDDYDSQRLHEELLNIHTTKASSQPDKHAAFLAAFRQLMPAVRGVERVMAWWDTLVQPTLNNLGQNKGTVADARAIVLNILAYDEDDDPSGEKKKASHLILDRLFEIFLEKTKLLSAEKMAGFAEEERQRFVCANVEAVLLSFGKRKPQQFLQAIDTYVVQKEYRLQALGLLCSYVRLQGPHLYYVVKTPLFEHLLQCLLIDTSTTVISLALTILIMFMPHICHYLSQHLAKLFVIYTRVLCWDKYGVVRLDDIMSTTEGKESQHIRSESPLSARADSDGNVWQKLDTSFETTTSTTPDVSDFFTFLYGLYPINFFNFIREPYKVLEKLKFPDVEELDIDEETIRSRSDQYRARHTIHPNFLSLTQEQELTDQNRWMKYEAAEITAHCIGLVNNPYPSRRAHVDYKNIKPVIPDALLPTEDIPPESLLNGEDEHGEGSFSPSSYWKDKIAAEDNDDTTGTYSRRTTGYATDSSHQSNRDSRTPDSPTIPPLVPDSAEESKVRDMLNLQESLRTGKHSLLSGKRNLSSHSLASPPGSHGNTAYGSAAASPRLDAYAHTLGKSDTARSPALRPAATDTQGTIAFLQREVMLLKNDLNFERYLKQQHLSHIGHLQRKQIKESTAEAETQNLINNNKALRKKLEEAKQAYSRLKQESQSSKTHSKKWENELNNKIRTLREEQRAWKVDEETVKRQLMNAQMECERLKNLLADSEAKELAARQKLQTLESQVEELDQLRKFVDQLREKVQEQESKAEEFEMQKLNEEAALTQLDRIKMRFQAREQEREKMKRAYDQRIAELESKLAAAQNAAPAQPGPNFQAMIDNALSAANARFDALKKSHTILFSRYTELEMKYLELQAIAELETDERPSGPGGNTGGLSQQALTSGTESPTPYSSSDFFSTERSFTPQPFGKSADPHTLQRTMSPTSPVETALNVNPQQSYFAQRQQEQNTIQPMSSLSNFAYAVQSGRPYPSPSLSGHKFSSVSAPPNYPPPSQPPTTAPPTIALSTTPTQTSTISSGPSEGGSSEHRGSDSVSIKTVTSTTSSEKRRQAEKIKAQDKVRVRGRGKERDSVASSLLIPFGGYVGRGGSRGSGGSTSGSERGRSRGRDIDGFWLC